MDLVKTDDVPQLPMRRRNEDRLECGQGADRARDVDATNDTHREDQTRTRRGTDSTENRQGRGRGGREQGSGGKAREKAEMDCHSYKREGATTGENDVGDSSERLDNRKTTTF